MHKRIYEDENGYAIILAIMLLAILMVAGVMTSNTTLTDLDISRNTVIQAQNEAVAESAAMTCVQIIENTNDKDKLDPELNTNSDWAWLNFDGELDENDENLAENNGHWKEMPFTSFTKLQSRFDKENAKIRYRAVGWEAARGASLGLYSDTLKEGIVKGSYYTPSNGIVTVEMGYKKRF